MPTMSLATQIQALWIVLPPVFVASFLLVFLAPLLHSKQAALAPVKPARDRVAVAAKDRDLAHGMRSGHPEHI